MKSKKDYIEVTIWLNDRYDKAYCIILPKGLTNSEILKEVERNYHSWYAWDKR